MNRFDSPYELPYPSAEINPYISLANNAASQADYAEYAKEANIAVYDNTMQQLLPQFPPDKSIYVTPVLFSTDVMESVFSAAFKARSAVSHSLNIALRKAEEILAAEQVKISQLEAEIQQLTYQSEQLRGDFTTATDTAIAADTAASTVQAKTLLDTLEITYEKHQLLKNSRQTLFHTQANIDYLKTKLDDCLEQINKLTNEQPQIQNSLATTRAAFADFVQPAAAPPPPAANLAEQAIVAPQPQAEENARPSAGALIWSYFKIILIALLFALVLRAYVIDITKVDGTSMNATLVNKDNIITAKIAYVLNEPERGDIIVFDAPDTAGEDYVKRIIGLPNEEIIIENGTVYIDGQVLKEPYLASGVYTDGEIRMVIPDGFYFVMGDNRTVSRDSRAAEVGVINKDLIHGKAVFRIFPFSSFGSIYK